MKKVMLAYSGGLDTSVILKWLINKGYEVIAYVADVGQDDDFGAVREKALAIGASSVIIDDLKREFVTDYIFQAVKANAVYEGRYLMGTALARPLIAKKQIEAAIEQEADYVAHGSTGKGNDQVRFELAYYALKPDIRVIAPWKDAEFLSQFHGRSDMIRYAAVHSIPVKASISKPYSEDDNLMHISHEAGILEDPLYFAGKDILQKMVMPMDAPDKETHISITFKDGIPVNVTNKDDGTSYSDPLELFTCLNRLGGANGIGLLDMVENRFVGIKSRGIYETPGATILYAAHRDIEGIAMDREVMRLRNMLAPVFAELVYNGFWFSPEMEFLKAAIDKSQEVIDGVVHMILYKGNVIIEGRESPSSLYNKELSSMDIEGGFNQSDSLGFIRINAIRLMAHNAIMEANKKKVTEDAPVG
ncbi:MAG TPA: argininosuccinate synthase [Bacteroidales bacterium]|jgi:argininosuccinate synthase|nr:argininosuccinate synthase [Bacteroidales bacterium]MBK7731983.1 argininosuccinate synthase [Bacteroidales bacterium]MBP7036091.1 argininosuccinate synthase [Bacteroidales bacterium]MBP8709231.1 argininosuccinate synthase [Bacteroidales bacterium]HOE24053.1 argininosuccinate synthase [Bacteroidales bacterium]